MAMFSPQDIPKIRSLLRNIWATRGATSWIRLIDTQSMTPTLSGNIFLLVKWTTTLSSFELGDLILFSSPPPEILVVHRVCHINRTEKDIQVLQAADGFVAGEEISGGWLQAESVLGRIIAIRWGESDARITRLAARLHRFFGTLISTVSFSLWEQTQQLTKYKTTPLWKLTWAATTVLHKLLLYTHAFLLHISARASEENRLV